MRLALSLRGSVWLDRLGSSESYGALWVTDAPPTVRPGLRWTQRFVAEASGSRTLSDDRG